MAKESFLTVSQRKTQGNTSMGGLKGQVREEDGFNMWEMIQEKKKQKRKEQKDIEFDNAGKENDIPVDRWKRACNAAVCTGKKNRTREGQVGKEKGKSGQATKAKSGGAFVISEKEYRLLQSLKEKKGRPVPGTEVDDFNSVVDGNDDHFRTQRPTTHSDFVGRQSRKGMAGATSF